MTLHASRQVLLALLVATVSACVSTELSTGPEHPANSRAPARPPPTASSALHSNFEPFAAYGVGEGSEASGHDHGAHGHGETEGDVPPTTPAPAPSGTDATPPVGQSAGGAAPAGDRASTPTPVPEAPGAAGRAAPPQKKKVKKPEYSCPMHPEVRSAEPGRCPKCGMPLVLEKQKAP